MATQDELALLVAEQERDDTYVISRPNQISLDAVGDLLGVSEDGLILDFTSKEPVSVGAGEHGTLTAYAKHECRCCECKQAWAKYYRERRAKKRAER